MEPQFAYAPARGAAGGGHGETDAEDMQHMWQFLDASLPTPPTAAHAAAPAAADASHAALAAAAGPPPAVGGALHEPALTDDDNGMYNELGDVFNNLLFFGMDADEHALNPALGGHPAAKYSENGAGAGSVSAGGGMTDGATSIPAADAAAAQKVQLPRSASASSSHSGVDSISPVGLLGYPSMSPATINWLQSLATSASSESLSGLISPATMYSGSASITPSAVSGSAGGVTTSAGPIESSKNGSLPRSPSCEMIDWKAYNDAVGMAERTQKEPAKWRVIPQHGPHADPTTGNAPISTFPGSGGAQPPHHPVKADTTLGDMIDGDLQAQMAQTGVPHHVDSGNLTEGEGGLRTHLTRQFETIKSTVVSIVGALGAPEIISSAAMPAQGSSIDGAFHGGHPSAAMNTAAQMQGARAAGPPSGVPGGLSMQAQMQLSARRMTTEEKNKRKAIISPEYVQYGSTSGAAGSLGNPALFGGDPSMVKIEGELGQMQFATAVPDPTGRRPSKKSLHHAGSVPATRGITTSGATTVAAMASAVVAPPPRTASSMSLDTDASTSPVADSSKDEGVNPAQIRCKCTGKCRNARCACVKAGLVCGIHCKCVSCANPFVPMEKEGIDIQKMVKDVCLMQYLSKVKDMQELLDSTVAYECCDGVVQVKHTIESGFSCPHCNAHYTYSWCSNKLCHDQKKPRKHCAKCRRCGDHRNEHCDDCNHCYFAGVANSFSCSCKSGKPVTGSGVKARSVVPTTGRDGEGGGSTSSKVQSPPDLFGTRDENANGSNLPSGSSSKEHADGGGQGTVASGLSGPDNEGDDSCKMQ